MTKPKKKSRWQQRLEDMQKQQQVRAKRIKNSNGWSTAWHGSAYRPMNRPATMVRSSILARCWPAPAPTGPAQADDALRTAIGATRTIRLFFSCERTPCFGQCPAFRIDMYRSGMPPTTGRSNVERKACYTGRGQQDTLAALLKEAEGVGFFDLDDPYDGHVTDLPSMHLRLVAAMGRTSDHGTLQGTHRRFKEFGV